MAEERVNVHIPSHPPVLDSVQLRNIQLPLPVAPEAWHRPGKSQPCTASLKLSYSSAVAAAIADDVSLSLDYGKLYRRIDEDIRQMGKHADHPGHRLISLEGSRRNSMMETEVGQDVRLTAALVANCALGLLDETAAGVRRMSHVHQNPRHSNLMGTVDLSNTPSKTPIDGVFGQCEVWLHLPKALLRAEEGLHYRSITVWGYRQANNDAPSGETSERCPVVLEEEFQIKGIRCHCILGVNSHERVEKQAVIISLAFRGPGQLAWGSTVMDTYQAMTRSVAEKVEKTSFQTVEALATFIARIVTVDFANERVTVKVEKPSALAFVEGSGVEITRDHPLLTSISPAAYSSMCLSARSFASPAFITLPGCFANSCALSLSSDLIPACTISLPPSASSVSQTQSSNLSEPSGDKRFGTIKLTSSFNGTSSVVSKHSTCVLFMALPLLALCFTLEPQLFVCLAYPFCSFRPCIMDRMDISSTSSHDDLSVGDVFTPQADIARSPDGMHLGPKRDTGFRMTGHSPEPKSNPTPKGPMESQHFPAPNVNPLDRKANRGRKKKKQGNHVAPAISTVRGFNPLGSGDEDSDLSAASSRAPSSRPGKSGNSPIPQPSLGVGVSALKLQLDSLSISTDAVSPHTQTDFCSEPPSNASVCSDSDQTEVLTSYEVPLEHDYVSADAAAEESSQNTSSICDMRTRLCRKMTTDDFEPLLCLGKGSFGTVLLVRHALTGKLYAQKQFKKASITVHKKLVEQTKTERTILESVNRHPFVVKFFYAFQDHEKLYLILEYAQGGELFTHLAMERMFNEDVAAFYMAEMVLALEHLHQNVGVIYRDLKPENCLLDHEGHLLLTDFGLSKIAVDDDARCDSSLGTIEYMAPEVIQGKPYGKACDWWSLGALGYDLLTGSPPFTANNNSKLQEKILKQKLSLPYFLGPDAKDLLTRLLRKEPSKRLGYHMPKDLQTIKKHRFFRKIDWKALERRELTPPINPVVTDPAIAENFSVDFTQLALSPIVTGSTFDEFHGGRHRGSHRATLSIGHEGGDDPFGGFSFVASSSLLDHGPGIMTAGY
ncbi:hypothetical protein BDV59DRAFT_190815 [Aspergillus ambiguus]|uniref:uncharacterized protein n=1 Tax=Aspergillus ambiguus TaxID=176160 RepID=UPI003CCDDD55